MVDVDRDGKIFIEEVSAEMTDFTYDKSVVLEAPPTTKKYPLLKLSAKSYKLTPSGL